MALAVLQIKAISRSKGRSATGAAAYRSGEKIVDQRTGEIHDYTHKGDILHKAIYAPENSPDWAGDRERLWNEAEKSETKSNARVAREAMLPLPAEFNHEQRIELSQAFAKELVERHHVAVDVCMHAPPRQGDDRNFHAHVLFSTRRLDEHGFTEKTRELDDLKKGPEEIEFLRQRWGELQNDRLAEYGYSQRVDMRSYERQGIAREPEPHFGPGAIGYERRTGEKSHRRLDWEEEVMRRLKAAKDTGIEERRAASTPGSIVLDTDIASARQERDRADQEARDQVEQDRRKERERSERDERERTERERAERDDRGRFEREQRKREDRERTERDQRERDERDRSERERSERDELDRTERARGSGKSMLPENWHVEKPADRQSPADEQVCNAADHSRERTLTRAESTWLDESVQSARGLPQTREQLQDREITRLRHEKAMNPQNPQAARRYEKAKVSAEESSLARIRREAQERQGQTTERDQGAPEKTSGAGKDAKTDAEESPLARARREAQERQQEREARAPEPDRGGPER